MIILLHLIPFWFDSGTRIAVDFHLWVVRLQLVDTSDFYGWPVFSSWMKIWTPRLHTNLIAFFSFNSFAALRICVVHFVKCSVTYTGSLWLKPTSLPLNFKILDWFIKPAFLSLLLSLTIVTGVCFLKSPNRCVVLISRSSPVQLPFFQLDNRPFYANFLLFHTGYHQIRMLSLRVYCFISSNLNFNSIFSL